MAETVRNDRLQPPQPDDTLQLGSNDQFVIERALAKGGFGMVYLAEQIETTPSRTEGDRYIAASVVSHGRVAVKWQPRLPRFTDRDWEEQKRELESVSLMNHPHILSPVKCGYLDENTMLVAMPYCGYGTVAQVLETQTNPDDLLGETLAYTSQIAGALQYAHAQGLIHRDVKPANILIRAPGHAVLTDFGLATPMQRRILGEAEAAAGTVAYAAPEQIKGKAQTASDQYSLGMVFYELLTKVRPLERSEGWKTEAAQLTDIVPGLPPDLWFLNDVVQRALAKDPKDRFPSALAFAEALCHAAYPYLSGKWQRYFDQHAAINRGQQGGAEDTQIGQAAAAEVTLHALRRAEDAANRHPASIRAHYDRAQALLQLGRKAEAQAVFTFLLDLPEVLRDDPYLKGLVLQASGHHAEAIACFERAMERGCDQQTVLDSRDKSLGVLDKTRHSRYQAAATVMLHAVKVPAHKAVS